MIGNYRFIFVLNGLSIFHRHKIHLIDLFCCLTNLNCLIFTANIISRTSDASLKIGNIYLNISLKVIFLRQCKDPTVRHKLFLSAHD